MTPARDNASGPVRPPLPLGRLPHCMLPFSMRRHILHLCQAASRPRCPARGRNLPRPLHRLPIAPHSYPAAQILQREKAKARSSRNKEKSRAKQSARRRRSREKQSHGASSKQTAQREKKARSPSHRHTRMDSRSATRQAQRHHRSPTSSDRDRYRAKPGPSGADFRHPSKQVRGRSRHRCTARTDWYAQSATSGSLFIRIQGIRARLRLRTGMGLGMLA